MSMKEPCEDCKYHDTDVCCECPTYDGSCTCHTGNPPCGYCEGSLWEEEAVKASSTVPDAKPIDKGDMSMSTTNFECKAVLVETVDGKETKTVVARDPDIFEESQQDAKDTFLLDNAEKINKAKETGKVGILCRPFCG